MERLSRVEKAIQWSDTQRTHVYIHVYSWKRFDGEFFFPGHNGNRIGARLGFLINGIGRVKEETD